MTKLTRKLMGAAALTALSITPAAFADEISTVVIEQVETGDMLSDLNVHIETQADDLLATSTSVGNTATGHLMSGDLDYDAFQTMDGNSSSNVSVNCPPSVSHCNGSVYGATQVVSTAYGNASDGGTWDGNSFYRAEQTMNGDTSATSNVYLENVGALSTSTTAAANVSISASEYGDNRSFQIQESNGSVYAGTDAHNTYVNDGAVYQTTALGNTTTSSGSTSTSFNGAVQTTAEGEHINANSYVTTDIANNVGGSTTAVGNSHVLSNEWGFATLGRDGSELFQDNASHITSNSIVHLGEWSGAAHSTAYGVGNTASVSNIGSDTNLFANQTNTGGVDAHASFAGTSWTGGTGYVNSVAIGNSASAFLCTTCGDAAIGGAVNQVNSGNILATANVHVGTAGLVVGNASAIGNSASFSTSGD